MAPPDRGGAARPDPRREHRPRPRPGSSTRRRHRRYPEATPSHRPHYEHLCGQGNCAPYHAGNGPKAPNDRTSEGVPRKGRKGGRDGPSSAQATQATRVTRYPSSPRTVAPLVAIRIAAVVAGRKARAVPGVAHVTCIGLLVDAALWVCSLRGTCVGDMSTTQNRPPTWASSKRASENADFVRAIDLGDECKVASRSQMFCAAGQRPPGSRLARRGCSVQVDGSRKSALGSCELGEPGSQ
jgi:hypothetical protein